MHAHERNEPMSDMDSQREYLLTAYLFGDISEAGRAEIEQRLASSEPWRRELDNLRTTLGCIEDVLAADGGDYSFEARRLERVLNARPARLTWRPAWTERARPVRRGTFLQIAAAAAILLVGVGLILPGFLSVRSSLPRVAYDGKSLREGAGVTTNAPGSASRSSRRAPEQELEEAEARATSDLYIAGDADGDEVADASDAVPVFDMNISGGVPNQTATPAPPAATPPAVTAATGSPDASEVPSRQPTSGRAAGGGGRAGGAGEPAAAPAATISGRKGDGGSGDRGGAADDFALSTPERDGFQFGGARPFGVTKPNAAAKSESAELTVRQDGLLVDRESVRSGEEVTLYFDEDSRSEFDAEEEAEVLEEFLTKESEVRGRREKFPRRRQLRRDVVEAKKKSKARQAAKERMVERLSHLDAIDGSLTRLEESAEDRRALSREQQQLQGQQESLAKRPGAKGVKDVAAIKVLEAKQGKKSDGEDPDIEGETATRLAAKLPTEALATKERFYRGDDNSDGLHATEGLPSESHLRAYAYYQQLDRKLSWGRFRAQRLEIPPPAVGDEGLGRLGFRDKYGVNPFVDTRSDNQSTFAMDVDTASFTRAREILRAGSLPDPKQVRVEEFVNYFRQHYPADSKHAFSLFSEGAPAPFGNTGVELLQITVKARELLKAERRNAVLTFCLDTSGSMYLEDRVELLKTSLGTLVRSLQPEDRVAIVAYGAQAYLILPHTPARDAKRILDALSSLNPNGASNVEAGLELAYRIADETFQPRALNRVVLCSDGVATAGARGPEAILQKVKVYAQRGIYLSTVGFGRQKYNDRMMERLANEGNGRYDFVASAEEAKTVLGTQLPSTLQVLAKDAKIQVVFNEDVVGHYRLLGYENRDIKDHLFRDDTVDAGEVGPGTTVTALYEVARRPNVHGSLGEVFVRYHDTTTLQVEELKFPLQPVVMRNSLRDTTENFRIVACAAEAAELLRKSYWARNGSFENIRNVLRTLPLDSHPQLPELREVVEQGAVLSILNSQASLQTP